MKIRKLSDVVDWRLCLGCGACAYAAPAGAVQLFDHLREGIRPRVVEGSDTAAALSICPALNPAPLPSLAGEAQADARDPAYVDDWGPVLDIWEGHATDPEIRFRGSSGGALTALAAYCLEREDFAGVLHTGADRIDPLRNRTRLSRDRAELLAAAGSRYAPAAVCDGLGLVESASSPCVVIGKPVDIAAVRNAQRHIPALDRKIGLTLSFFCAETPSTAGTVDLLRKLGANPEEVRQLRYRGYGWPGNFTTDGGEAQTGVRIPYCESWSFLQSYRAWSTHLWPDGTGEAADISCGDPWYERPDGKNAGFSLVVVRTETGRRILRGAVEAGYLQLTRAEAWKLEKSQGYLRKKKAAVWGRIMAMRMFGLPVPTHDMRTLFRCWRKLSLKEKLQSTLGTVHRILRRRLFRRLELDDTLATAVKPAFTHGSSAGGAATERSI